MFFTNKPYIYKETINIMKKTKEKYIPTTEDINTMYDYCNQWKPFFKITYDDIQDIALKFFKYYNPDDISIKGCTNKLIKQHLYTNFHNKNLQKNQYNGILQLDELDFDSKYLAINDNTLETKEQQQADLELIKVSLKYLTQRQRRAFEMYFIQELTLREIGEIEGITYQGVRDRIKMGAKRINRMMNKN